MVGQEPEDPRPGRAVGPDQRPDPEDGQLLGPDPEEGQLLGPDPEDRKPLYRDEVPPQKPGQGRSGPPAGDETEVRTRLTPRSGRVPRDPDGETQILPRTQRPGLSGPRSDFDRDPDDDLDDLIDERPAMRRRTKLALVVAGVAAVAIVGLAIGYAVLHLGDRATAPAPGGSSTATGAAGSASPSPEANALLTQGSMLGVAQAKQIVGDRSWKVALTQRGVDADSSQPACLDSALGSGQPPPQQTLLRLLSSAGSSAPGILHQADAYATPEDATFAYTSAAKALGGCSMAGASIASGQVINGLGDQSSGIVLNVTQDGNTQFRSVVLNRTGRVVNVVDVAQPNTPVPMSGVVAALAGATARQCGPAGGRCPASPVVKEGPPPIGGDRPGFLATADLPPVGAQPAIWVGTVPGAPNVDFTGSGCETVDWRRVAAQKRTARTYLLQDESPTFGLDDIVLTQSSEAAAQAIVSTVKADLDSCAKRKLTATVSTPVAVSGLGANGVAISGWQATVTQKTTTGTASYRVGIVSAGAKTAFTFLNPQPGVNLTDAQWQTVVVRAGQRATQVR